MPVKKTRALVKARAKPKVSGGPNSFQHFVGKLRSTDPVVASIRDHAAANNFPDIESWAQIRSYMTHTGAAHEAMVGARIAWREFRRG